MIACRLSLKESDYAAWLDASVDTENVAALMRPFNSAAMECYPVSPAVNNVRNETLACLSKSRSSRRR